MSQRQTSVKTTLKLPSRILLCSLEVERRGHGTDVCERYTRSSYDKVNFSNEVGAKCIVAPGYIKSRSVPKLEKQYQQYC